MSGDTESLIKILPPEVSNKIAAGEVVQRPASVVKELLDNAIDAAADQITIVIGNSGRTLIQVRDNGCGMSGSDLKHCFLRHATSKLASVDDLINIRTLGFRGEAMASIASVAQITVTSKRKEDDAGMEYEIRGGEEVRLEPAAADDGTTVTVRNLFYNVPARRAFLKTDATELRHILLAVHQASIAHPEIAFELEVDGETVYKLQAGDRENRIAALFGKSYHASLIHVSESTSLVKIYGLLSDPKLAKKTRGEQFLFINKRPFLHRHLNYIIQDIYSDWIRPGQYPFYALFYEVDPEMVDVNVHPSKQEIKFEDERTISTFTRSVVKKALNDHMRVPIWDPDEVVHSREQAFDQGFSGSFSTDSTSRVPGKDRNFNLQAGQQTDSIPDDITGTLYGAASDQSGVNPDRQKRTSGTGESEFWQIHNEFIISQTRNGMLIMDQHAAHKRIIYEKVLNEAESGLPGTQQLLFPKNINLSASDFSLLKELHPVITRMGFNVQLLSGNSAMIIGVPSDIRLDDEQHVLESIMEQYKRMAGSVSLSGKERVALALANKAAIPRGKKITTGEMEALVDQLFACDEPFRDPIGKPTIKSLSVEELRGMFR